MNDVLLPSMKVALVVFVAGNLLEMGLRLDPRDALKGLRNPRFILLTLAWGFLLGPALAYAITRVIPLAPPHAAGLMLVSMAPCAPFLPALAGKAGGDLGYTAAFMLVVSAAMVVLMPLAVPVLVEGLDVDAWTIEKPMLVAILLPVAAGMAILRASPAAAAKLQPLVKKATAIATAVLVALAAILYGPDLIGIRGSLAGVSQVLFFLAMGTLPYVLGAGLPHEQKIVLTVGMASRNIGAAIAPLLSVTGIDERAVVMVVLGLPVMIGASLLSARAFGRATTAAALPAGAASHD